MKDQISSGEETQGLVPAPWDLLEDALNRKERRSKSFIWYSIAAGVLLVFSAIFAGLQWGSTTENQPATASVETQKSTATTTEAPSQPTHSENNAISNSPAELIPEKIENSTSAAGYLPSKTHNFESNNSSSNSQGVDSKISNTDNRKAPNHNLINPPATSNNQNAAENPAVVFAEAVGIPAVSIPEVLVEAENPGMSWMLDAAGMSLYPTELLLENKLTHDLAQLNADYQSNKIAQGSLDRLASCLELGKIWMEISADQNQTGLSYHIPTELSQYVHKNYKEQMGKGETALGAGRVQIALNWFVSKNSSVKIGLAYANNKIGQNFSFRDSMPAVVSAGQTPDANGNFPIFGYLGLGPEVTYKGMVNYSFLSVPIGWSGYLPIAHSKTLFFTPEVVLQPNYFQLNTGAQTLDYQTLLLRPMDEVNYKSLVFSARIAAGIQKRLNYRHAVGARVNAQGVLNSMNTAKSPVQTRGWSSGLTLYYSFKID